MLINVADMLGQYGFDALVKVAAVEQEDPEAPPTLDSEAIEAQCRAASDTIQKQLRIPPRVLVPAMVKQQAMAIAYYRLHLRTGKAMPPEVETSHRAAIAWLARAKSGQIKVVFQPIPKPNKRRPKGKAAKGKGKGTKTMAAKTEASAPAPPADDAPPDETVTGPAGEPAPEE